MLDGLLALEVIDVVLQLLRGQVVEGGQEPAQLHEAGFGIAAGGVELDAVAGRDDHPFADGGQCRHLAQGFFHGGGGKGDPFPDFHGGGFMAEPHDDDVHDTYPFSGAAITALPWR